MKTKKISQRYFDDLKNLGHGVPRIEETGEQIKGRAGENYIFIGSVTGEKITVRCTQSGPYHYRILKTEE